MFKRTNNETPQLIDTIIITYLPLSFLSGNLVFSYFIFEIGNEIYI